MQIMNGNTDDNLVLEKEAEVFRKDIGLQDYTFSDLFDLKEIQRLQDAFSKATGVSSLITEPDGTPITIPSGFSCLCERVIRKTGKGLENCIKSDAIIGSPKKDGPRIQKCLSLGLIDGGASIMAGDRHLANWMIGQVMDADEAEEGLLAYADEIGLEKEIIRDGLEEIVKMPKKQFEKIADFLFLNAKYLSELAVKNLSQRIELQRRIDAEAHLIREKELFKATIRSIGEGIITTDTQGHITSLNKVAELLTGWAQSDAYGSSFEKIFHTVNDETRFFEPNLVEKILETGQPVRPKRNVILLAKDGVEYCIENSGTPIKDANGTIYGAVIVFRDITEEKEYFNEMKYLSCHDTLTGLSNRAKFEKELERLVADNVYPVSVIMGDVNGLKFVNDVFGHQEGDKLLKTVGNILKESCRQGDLAARFGGDEFIIILAGTSYEESDSICRRIMVKCEQHGSSAIKPSISLGVATKSEPYQDIGNIIKSAESRMYRNKLFESKSKESHVLGLLQKVLYEKSCETEEHALRLMELSEKMGHALNLRQNEKDDLKLLASLHDIGKVGISDNILLKPSKLTSDEWEEMKRHSEIGYRIAQASAEVSHISEYILFHHERWDGRGYPQGRMGKTIPLLSRIISLIDAYDVMVNSRSYKTASSKDDALEEIKKCAGTQFDPDLSELFIQLMEENKKNDTEW